MCFRIRRYRDADLEAVWTLHHEALLPTGAHLGPGPWDDDLSDIPGRYLDGSGEFLVGELEGRLIAMAALRRFDGTTAELKRMRVLPPFQNQGYGGRVLEALEDRARQLGYTAVRLDTTDRQVQAQRFYAKHGYHRIGEGTLMDQRLLFYEKAL